MQFSADPKILHDQEVKSVLKYLKGTLELRLIINSYPEEGIECYVDVDFTGGRNQEEGKYPGYVISKMGYTIIYVNLRTIWANLIQTEIELTTTDTEYIDLSPAMRDILPFLILMKEIEFVIKL